MIIDLVVASVLMSMGMMMLSPVLISLPFKLMLFVLVDGWTLVMGTLASSFYPDRTMTPETIMAIGGRALEITLLLAAPLLLAALVTGLMVGAFQAATSINEMTLSFIPKLIAIAVTIVIAGPWMLKVLVGYTRELFTSIPGTHQLTAALRRHDHPHHRQLEAWLARALLAVRAHRLLLHGGAGIRQRVGAGARAGRAGRRRDLARRAARDDSRT